MKSNKFIVDVLLNIVSVALPLFVLQLISLPIVASRVGGETYGVVIAVISTMTIISFPMGNGLNNTRLLRDEQYQKEKVKGDFNFLLSSGAFLSALVMAAATWLINPQTSIISVFILIIVIVASIAKDYLVVGFRLNLNYRNIFFNNLWLAVGYLVGTWLFSLLGYWQLIYLVGLIFSLIYIVTHLTLHKEAFGITSQFQETWKIGSQLYIAGLLKALINYADKLILLPILGPLSVSVYYSATIIGKLISMVINPVNSVLLSYLVKMKSFSLKKFFVLLCILSLLSFSGYFITIWISPYFFNLVYPDWASDSIKIVRITTATAVISMMSALIQPFNLRFNNTKWQIYMSILYLVIYLGLSITLAYQNGLIGFSWGVLIAAVFNLSLQLAVFILYAKKAR